MADHRPRVVLTWLDGHEEIFYLTHTDSWSQDLVRNLLRFKRGAEPQQSRSEIPIQHLRYWEVYPRL